MINNIPHNFIWLTNIQQLTTFIGKKMELDLVDGYVKRFHAHTFGVTDIFFFLFFIKILFSIQIIYSMKEYSTL